MAWFKSYGHVGDSVDAVGLEARRKSRRRVTVISLSSIVLIAVVAVVVVVCARKTEGHEGGGAVDGSFSTSMKSVCDTTLYPATCAESLAPLNNETTLDPLRIFRFAVNATIDQLTKVSAFFNKLALDKSLDSYSAAALAECGELIALSADELNNTFSATDLASADVVDDLKTWLSSALTYQHTCMDDMENASAALRAAVDNSLVNSTQMASNSLAILSAFSTILGQFKLRKLLSTSDETFPGWLSSKDRRLLENPDAKLKADIVVAKDGSGKYKTIKEAIKAVPSKSKKRTVIYVKKGVYKEKVIIDKNKWNIMMVGDGMYATIVTGSLNFIDGTPTFDTATLAALGKGFIAKDMGFENTAGAAKHQAVALMSNSDLSVFYRCSMSAFQDTLYAHANRQFYRECDITGTIDFIFGNSAVVFQNCNIMPRAPMKSQFNTITAQGRVDPNQNTGISIHNCNIKQKDNVKGVKVYLGRPWKPYAVTVFMKSTMAGIIDPAGWIAWSGNTAPATIFYSEYQNSGPGASTKNRVKWKGLKSMTVDQANKFTVAKFINGKSWIPATGVPFTAGL